MFTPYFTSFTHQVGNCVTFFDVITRSVASGTSTLLLSRLPLLDMRYLLTALLLLELTSVTAQPPASSFGGGGSSYGPASSSSPPPPPAVSPNSMYDLRTCQNRQGESASPAEGYALQFGPQTIATAYVDTYVPRPPYSTGDTLIQGSLPAGPHVMCVGLTPDTRTSLGRAVPTMYRGTTGHHQEPLPRRGQRGAALSKRPLGSASKVGFHASSGRV